MVVLSTVYMNNVRRQSYFGKMLLFLIKAFFSQGAMKGDALEAFLKKMRLIKDDTGGMDPLIEEYFGDVKSLIDKEWVPKLHYLECKKIDDDPDHQQYEYKW